MNQSTILGADLGMGAIKLYGSNGPLQFLSQISVNGAKGVTSAIAGLRSAAPPLHISINGQSFYVGASAHDWGRPVEAMDYSRLNSLEFHALLWGALTQYAPSSPLQLVVGLPVELIRGEDADANIAAIRTALKGSHAWQSQLLERAPVSRSLDIADVRVTSQATGALFDFLLDEAGALRTEAKQFLKSEIGIISIGFNTVELMTVREKQVVQRFTAGATVGVRRLLELVNTERLYSLAELDARLRAKRLDVSTQLPVWEREIAGFIETQWGTQWKRFAKILIVGGGALLLKERIVNRFQGKGVVADDPVFSIARGLYKLALSQKR